MLPSSQKMRARKRSHRPRRGDSYGVGSVAFGKLTPLRRLQCCLTYVHTHTQRLRAGLCSHATSRLGLPRSAKYVKSASPIGEGSIKRLRVVALALPGPPLQLDSLTCTLCPKPLASKSTERQGK